MLVNFKGFMSLSVVLSCFAWSGRTDEVTCKHYQLTDVFQLSAPFKVFVLPPLNVQRMENLIKTLIDETQTQI